jgi:hypothetical protein
MRANVSLLLILLTPVLFSCQKEVDFAGAGGVMVMFFCKN